MYPSSDDDQSTSYHSSHSIPRIFDAGAELESLCRAEMSNDNKILSMLGVPPSCLPIVRLLAGNQCCVDCGCDQSDSLNYASIGYGTILCRHCAHRHKTLLGEYSNVKHIKEDNWNLRSTLSLLEGGNRRLLEFVKQRSQQRSPKSIDSYSEDVISFNNVYKSDVACEYREHLSEKVESTFLGFISSRKREDEAKVELLNAVQTSHCDQCQNIRPQSYDEGATSSIDTIKQKIDIRRRSIHSVSGSTAFEEKKKYFHDNAH